MAGVTETATWENHVYRIEENDPVHGGEEGVSNKPIKHLANRTLYLRNLLTQAGQRINPLKITATTRNSNNLTGHTHEIDLASLTTKGLVQLTNDTGLDSEALALTAKAGKAISQTVAQLQQTTNTGLNQKANKSDVSDAVSLDSSTSIASSKAVKTANDNANGRVSQSGDTMTGHLLIKAGDYASTRTYNSNGWSARWEGAPLAGDYFAAVVYANSSEAVVNKIGFPKKNGTVALAEEVVAKSGGTMTGELVAPYFKATGNYISVSARNGEFAGFEVLRQGSNGNWQARFEALPDKRWKFWTADGYSIFMPNRNGDVALAQEVVAKSGDTMNGILNLDYGNFSSLNQWNEVRRHTRIETMPDNNDSFYKMSYRADNGNTELHAVHFPKRGTGKTVAYEDWVDNGYIPRNGDTVINGRHFFKTGHGFIGVVSTNQERSGVDFTNWNGKHPQCSIEAHDVGNFADELRFFTTPQGSHYETDRRQHSMTLGYDGAIWSRMYGWLHDYFAKSSDVRNVQRSNQSRSAQFPQSAGNYYSTYGSVAAYPDGRIEQIFHLQNVRLNWFDFEVSANSGDRGRSIPIPLWTAMPNKITKVHAQFVRAVSSNEVTYYAEAGEWVTGWQLYQDGSTRSQVTINASRIKGDRNELVDLYVVVEGY